MSRRGCFLAEATVGLLLATAFGSSIAFGQSADVTAAVQGDYLYNTDIGASAFDGRVDVDVAFGMLNLGAVYRAYQLSDAAYNPAGIELPASEIKHRYAEFESGDLYARAGHFFSTFGQGLTLRSFEDMDLEYDTVLDGLLVEYGAGPVAVAGLAGTMTEHLFAERFREHTVRGARAQYAAVEWLDVAASAVERIRRDHEEEISLPDSVARYEDVVLGGEVSAWVGPVSLAAEYAATKGEFPAAAPREIVGHGTYVTGTYSNPWLTLMGEYKDYDGFAHTVSSPPNCVREHLWTLMNRVTHEVNYDDEQGFLIEGTLTAFDELSLLGGASEARFQDGELAFWEMFAQLDHWLWERAPGTLAWSWSREYERDPFTGRSIFTEHLSGAVELSVSLSEIQELELTLEAQTTEEPTGDTHGDYLASAAWYASPTLTLVLSAESTNEEDLDRDSWLFGEARTLLGEDLEFSVGAGTERGGKKCSGGVCYTEPEFTGARVRFSKFF